MAIVLAALGLAFVALGVAGWSGRLRRNRFAGVRTPAAMSCEEAFALANRVAGPSIVTAGVLLVLAGAGVLGLDGAQARVVAGLGVAGSVGMLIAGGRLGARAAELLGADGPHDRCADCTGCVFGSAAPGPSAAAAREVRHRALPSRE